MNAILIYDHPLDLDLEADFSLLSIESVSATANNIDDCFSSTSSFSSAGTCAACFSSYACIISCGS